jgi:hypothetical protein
VRAGLLRPLEAMRERQQLWPEPLGAVTHAESQNWVLQEILWGCGVGVGEGNLHGWQSLRKSLSCL